MTRLIALVGIVTISFSAIMVRLADVAPATAGLFRAAYALPVLLILRAIRGDSRPLHLRRLALIAGTFLAADVALWHTSIALIGAGLATVLANTQVVWVGAAAWVIHAERPTPTAFVVVPIVLAGVALIGGIAGEDAFGSNPGLGALLGVVAGLFYAAFLLIFRQSNTQRGPTTGPLTDASIGMAAAFLAGGWLDPGFSLVPTFPAHWWLILLGTVIHAGGWLLIALALPRLPALETSVMLLLQPALTLIWAMIIFTERLSGPQWMGAVLVLGGVAGAATRGLVRPAAEGDASGP